MAPNRSSSPTSLLWAHQLKREHGFLLERMKKLESAISRVENTAKTAEAAANSNDIVAVASKVQSLHEYASNTVIDRIRSDVMGRLEKMSAEMEAIVVKVDSLERTDKKLDEDRKRAFSDEKAIVKRVKEVEESLKQYTSKLQELGDRVEEDTIADIQRQLQRLLDQTRSDKLDVKATNASLRALETITKELKKGYQELTEKIDDVDSRPQPVTGLRAGHVNATAAPETVNNSTVASTILVQKQPVRKKVAPKPKFQPATKVTPAKRARGLPAKSSKVLEPTLASQRLPRVIPKKDVSQVKIEQPLVRAGRGWIEVARTASTQEVNMAPTVFSNDQNVHSSAVEVPRSRGRPRKVKPAQSVAAPQEAPMKRGRGRPRKNATPLPQVVSIVPEAPRRKIKQLDETQASVAPESTSKHKAAILSDELRIPGPPTNATSMGVRKQTVLHEHTLNTNHNGTITGLLTPQKKKLRRGLTNIFSSPISSPPTIADHLDVQLREMEAEQAVKQSPVIKRRKIKQHDE